jgi:general secretion pathway protein G
MLTSVFYHPPSKPRSPGFTLIEVLVVLVIVGLLAGVALPKLFLLSQRYAIAADRDKLLTDIGNLGYSAYTLGKTVELVSSSGVAAQANAISVPSGWRIEVPKAIRFNFNGICSGGTLALINPEGARENFQLVAPACKPVASGSAP